MTTLLATLEAILGPGGLLTGEAAAERAFSPWTRAATPLAIARPRSAPEVAQVLRTVAAAGGSIVPWGGRTGLVEGTAAEGAVALSLDRMAAVEDIDPVGQTMTVQAGCVLATACEAAAAQGLFLPLDLGSRGSATIGGTISTNAGGNRVLRYGMMRDMVLGLEVVLADGTIVTGLNRLIKNNAGYDLKQLFIGSEGTLGIVTRAVLRLRPTPPAQGTALLAVDTFEALPRLLRALEAGLPGLSAFEVMWPEFYRLVTTEPARGRPILPDGHGYYVLVETLGPEDGGALLEARLEAALADGLVTDAVIAKSQAERDRMWALRDDVAQVARNGPVATFDVSLPITAMPDYVAGLRAAVAGRWPGASVVVFGHLGDGNLHVIVGLADDATARPEVEALVYGPLATCDGSISAEHGVGLSKRGHLGLSRSPEELDLMRRLKAALDPAQLLNPGKVLPPADGSHG
ncbi:MAG: FAD-linked oxidase [Phenylobacterium sp. RIFCSPHIGHO2_01_FULL_69_31]|uniref:FAD-binding oxidoreductase n=1 Tax=Phenylobacterium sp. RIFCSPHIGHO2_01_FULL_69_31 TaxID=1801944 RepID=UPI0008CD3F65|nr:FAD-binding oxidoreductase [Phenylobacterium sp. RIFCSPHIGHO2_01_FULL_69_31]OHB31842.1 MAG: FAD-linked oxidase [Phenylobacterium sp. RIFCSPHIGHO2_01_FULL_69_31]